MLFSSVQSSRSVVSDSLQSHESQHARPPCPSPAPGVHSNSTSIESVMLLLSNSKHYSKLQKCLLELQIQREEEERGRDLTQESYQGGRQGCFRLRKDFILVWLSLTALFKLECTFQFPGDLFKLLILISWVW